MSLLSWFTVRGVSFLAAGTMGLATGLLLGSGPVISAGVLLLCLPAYAAWSARRARHQVRCERQISPARVAPGQPATVTLRLENLSRNATSLLLAEDAVPLSLRARPRFVVNAIERGGTRELTYRIRSDLRGKFTIGPLRIRIADVFGLVELAADYPATSTLTVTPQVVPLSATPVTGAWSADGGTHARIAAAAGDDDVVPRPYRTGDELRRVHWRSTARYGELMVRREEQPWQDHVVLILDTRRNAHAGTGPGSSFEFAVSAAASAGTHLARAGMAGQVLTDAGPLAGGGMFEDVLLDALSVVAPSRHHDFGHAIAPLSTVEGGTVVLVAGLLSATEAHQIAAARRQDHQGIAILLAVSTWNRREQAAIRPVPPGRAPLSGPADPGTSEVAGTGPEPGAGTGETAIAEAILRAAGWRVVCADSATPLAVTWQRLPRADFAAPGGEPVGQMSQP